MIFKLIYCEVDVSLKEVFSHAQSQWKSLENLPGFLLQIGGWQKKQTSEDSPEIAWVLGFWKNEAFYQDFVSHHHDAIVESTQQIGTYKKCLVVCFETEENPLNRSMITSLSEADSLKLSFHKKDQQFMIKSHKQFLKLTATPLHKDHCNRINLGNEVSLENEAAWVVGHHSTQ